MNIKRFILPPIDENCYIISQDKKAAIIDCGCFDEASWVGIREYIKQEGLQLEYALQTHMHFDHVFGLEFVHRDFGLLPLGHQADEYNYVSANERATQLMGVPFNFKLPKLGRFLTDGETITLGDLNIEVIHTPGHTPGGICFYIKSEGVLFSGDTLFKASVGRTDLPGGNMSMQLESIQERLYSLPDTTKVYPGHGPNTSISYEKKFNMYV